VRSKCGKHRLRILRPGPIVEGQHHLTFAKEVMGFEVFEAKAGAASGIDLDYTADPQSIRITLA
jgi:hypothetical protein